MTFSSMYIAATGMIALGTGMQTISNNLANIETNGFKTMRTNYSDLFSKVLITSAPWAQQVGHGGQVQSIQSMFTQGAFKTSESPLDLALAGDGFFNVRSRLSLNLPNTEEIMYTRAGAYTLDRNGYMEDQSHNILQGWAMSLPRPGETPVRLGSPVDVQITALVMPPLATSLMRQIVNLDAQAATAYDYPAYGLTEEYAKAQAELAGQAARGLAELAVWNPNPTSPDTPPDMPVTIAGLPEILSAPPWNEEQLAEVRAAIAGSTEFLSASTTYDFNRFFIERYKEMFAPEASALVVGDAASAIATIEGMSLVEVEPPDEPDRASGQMTLDEFNSLTALALADIKALAAFAGQTAYASAYHAIYDAVFQQYGPGASSASQWPWEGNGYAGAWDGRRNPPIAPADYSHYETQTVYDENGRSHLVTTYYQKNPHELNVWDYIVTCEPGDDDRLDANGQPLTGTAMAGLLQKGKITFDEDGKIKDLEAQDLDPAAARAAYAEVTRPGTSALANIIIGGSYTGPGSIDPATGTQVSSSRTYTITYGWWDPAAGDTGGWRSANTTMNPPSLGFTWSDGINSGFVPVVTKYVLPGQYDDWIASQSGSSASVAPPPIEWTPDLLSAISSDYVPIISQPGPYTLGNDGLTLTFSFDPQKPYQAFGVPGESAQVTAHSEQFGWVADTPNAAGFFDVDVKFKNASAAQSLALDMGARQVGGTTWLLDSASTTLYGGRSMTVYSKQDGYPQGGLKTVYVTEDGYVTGVYSNNQEWALYQLCITRFLNPWGLQKMGNNLFAVSRHSGPGVTTAPGEGGAAVVLGGFLEQSNVDTATEIVNMIMTQRGFQANSKVVTTHDSMISTAIETKR